MRKRSLLFLFAILAAICALCFAACGSNGDNGGTGDGEKPSGEHNHSYIETVIEPTCTEKGYTLHKCECGDEYKDNETEALGHLFGEWKTITPATEGKDGEETRACTRENCEYTETRKIPKLEHTHSYKETVVEPTCTTKGYTLHKCSCGDEYKDNETEALGHLFGEWKVTTPATEEKDGEETRACTRENCDYTETRKIPKLEHTHSYKGTVVEPTCTEKGYTLHKCECGDEYKDNETEALGHLFGEWKVTTPATEEKDGEETRACTRENCDYFETRKIPKLEHTHSYKETVVEPTCTEKGYTLHKCECGDEYKDNYTEKIPHNYVNGKCTICGDKIAEATGLEYRLSDDKTYYIVTELGEETRTRFSIPATHNELPVKEIDELAFYQKTNIIQVILPDSIERIGKNAFNGCSSLEKVSFGKSLRTIEGKAFYECGKLGAVTVPNCLTSIGEKAFYYCSSLASINIPNGITDIGDGAFSSCHSLKSIIIPNSIKSIGDRVFYFCQSLTSITIADSVVNIGDSAFECCSSLTSINIPDSVTSIGEKAFSNCYLLTSITIPDSVTSIGNGVFSVCSSLTNVTIPKNMQRIGNEMFMACGALTNIVIPDSVVSIGCRAFYNCSSLSNLVIPYKVMRIEEEAFVGCNKLVESVKGLSYVEKWLIDCDVIVTKVELKDDIVGIADKAFYDCNALKSVTIPDSVTSIGEIAFRGCSSLTSINIPNSVRNIGKEAFYGCNSLTGVYITDIAAWCNIMFDNYASNPLYYANNLYLNNDLVIDLVIPDNVTNINKSAFYNCKRIISVTIPDSVASIGNYAFSDCSSLTSVTIGNNVTSIGEGAFYDCSRLVEVMNNSNLGIKKGSNLNGWVGFYAVNVKNVGKTDIVNREGYLFYTYDNINYLLGSVDESNELSLPDSYNGECYEIYRNAFIYRSSLTNVTIGNSVTSIGDYAFSNCSSLTSVTIPNSVLNIGSGAFSYCSSLRSIVIPQNITCIDSFLFRGCGKLTSITIPDSVKSVENYAFLDCDSLSTVYYKGTSEQWEKIVFGWNNNRLTSASRYYYSETEPTNSGNYWHYDENNDIVIW